MREMFMRRGGGANIKTESLNRAGYDMSFTLTVDMGRESKVIGFELNNVSQLPSQERVDYKIEGTVDGTVWETIFTASFVSPGGTYTSNYQKVLWNLPKYSQVRSITTNAFYARHNDTTFKLMYA